ncbi:MAG: EFR1 family ferrodoxin [Vallitaleaceae bacterium]|jgi:ferredoxin|nr:EFR1 family ferrodoxin [Vallitaleaceae bacterium]
MNNVIFCFTGTGNSLYVAKEVAKKIDAKVILIDNNLLNKSIIGQYDKVGIIFPVYHQGLPVMVSRFVELMQDIVCDNMFAISTYGHKPTLALEYLKKALQDIGFTLRCGYGVRMPYNYLMPQKIGLGMMNHFHVKLQDSELRTEILEDAKVRIERIAEDIINGVNSSVEVSDVWVEHMVDSLRLRDSVQKKQWLKITGYKGKMPHKFTEAISLMDAGFSVSDSCTGCGICQKVCPADNITLTDKKPVWQHNCEHCLACLHWCPNKSILFREKVVEETYNHPSIKVSELFNGR